jgi:hypothetical protein
VDSARAGQHGQIGFGKIVAFRLADRTTLRHAAKAGLEAAVHHINAFSAKESFANAKAGTGEDNDIYPSDGFEHRMGNVIVKALPFPAPSLSTQMSPPCKSITPLTMARPNPTPDVLLSVEA